VAAGKAKAAGEPDWPEVALDLWFDGMQEELIRKRWFTCKLTHVSYNLAVRSRILCSGSVSGSEQNFRRASRQHRGGHEHVEHF